jgi:protein O-mannosyl-transferase
MNKAVLKPFSPPVWFRWALPVLLVVFALGVYGRTLGYGFYWDDNHLSRPWTVSQLVGVFAGPFDVFQIEPPYFRPMVSISFALSWQVFGYEPWGYHLTNILLTCLVGGLVYVLARRVGLGWMMAWAVAFFFIVIPANAATAVYIANRGDSIMATFALLTLLSFDRYLRSKRLVWLALTNVGLILALCSKEMGLAVPLLLVVYGGFKGWGYIERTRPSGEQGLLALARYGWQALDLRHSWRRWALMFGPSVVIAGFYLVYRSQVLPKPEVYKESGNVLFGYISAIYQVLKAGPYGSAPWLIGLLLPMLGLAVLLQRNSYLWRYFWFGVVWVLAAVAPLSYLQGNIEPRLVYLVTIGYAMMVIALVGMVLDGLRGIRGRRYFWPMVATAVLVVVMYSGVFASFNVEGQDYYAPFSEQTLQHDKDVYTDPVMRARYPEVNVERMEEKLEQVGILMEDDVTGP